MSKYDYATYSNSILSMKDLSQNLYTRCSGYYDVDKDKYVRKSQLEIFKCCINNCDEYLDYCNSICDSKENCDKCYRYFEDCQEGCKTGDFWEKNYFNSCYRDTTCFNNYVTDLNCIESKKNELLDCCKKKCDSSLHQNCNEYCNYMYDFLINDVDNKNLSKWKNLQSKPTKTIQSSNESCDSLTKGEKILISVILFVSFCIILYSFS